MAASSDNSQRTPGRLNHAQRRVLNYKEKKRQNNTPVQNWDENVEDPLWQLCTYPASIPINMNYSQNIDFSTYPVLLERTFLDLEIVHPTIRREMPFCVFQHVCTSVLNAVVIDHFITYNSGYIRNNRYEGWNFAN